MKQAKVPVPTNVFDGLEAVRLSGKTNMFAVPRVIELAFETDQYAAGLWVHDNKRRYLEGIFAGFEPEDNPGEEGGGEPCADRSA